MAPAAHKHVPRHTCKWMMSRMWMNRVTGFTHIQTHLKTYPLTHTHPRVSVGTFVLKTEQQAERLTPSDRHRKVNAHTCTHLKNKRTRTSNAANGFASWWTSAARRGTEAIFHLIREICVRRAWDLYRIHTCAQTHHSSWRKQCIDVRGWQ